MPVVRSREVAVAIAGLSLAAALSFATAILTPESVGSLPPGSSLSKAADGSAAAYMTLQALGYTVSRSFEPAASLAVDPASTVLIIADPVQEPSAGDRRAVQTLAAGGATVVVTGCRGAAFLIDLTPATLRDAEPREFRALLTSPLTAGIPRISMASACARPELASRFLAVYGDSDVSAVWMSRVGRGLVVWWTGNTPIANATIDGPGHLELLLNAVGPPGRTILWDEFYHGQHRSLYSYAKQTPLPWLAVQVALVTVVAGFMYVRRRAPVVETPVESRVSPLEFVDTMSGLYARAGTAAEAVQTARTRLRRLLIEATGIAASAGDGRLASAAAARTGVSETELTQVLRASAAADDILPAEALSLVRRLQTCAGAIERRGA